MITSGYERSAPDTPHPPTPAAQLQPAAISGTSSRIGAVPVPANGHTTSPHKRCAQAPTPINFDHPDILDCALEGWPGIRSPEAKDYLASHQINAEGWYVAHPDLTVADISRLKRVGKAVDEFLDKIGD